MAEQEYGIAVYSDTSAAVRDTDRLIKALEELSGQSQKTEKKMERLESGARAVGNALKVAITAEVLRRAVTLIDEYTTLEVRMRQIVSSSSDANKVMRQLEASANLVGVSVAETMDTFQRFTFAREAIGATDEQLAAFNLTVQQLGALSGASTQAMSAGLLQLGQALTQPVVRMEEFNSLTENLPALVNEIALGLGVGNDELIAMARSGKLVSSEVFAALLERGTDVNAMFAELPDTSARAFQETKNIAQRELAEAFETEALAAFIRRFNKFLAVLPEGIRAAGALVSQGVGDMIIDVEEFFTVDIPKFLEFGFQEAVHKAELVWVQFLQTLEEGASNIPLLGNAISFDPEAREAEVKEIIEAYNKALVTIQDSYAPMERTFDRLREAGVANTKKYLDEFFAAMEESDSELNNLLNVDRTINPPKISGKKLEEAREAFFEAFGRPSQQIEIEYQQAVREIDKALTDFVITEEEHGAVLQELLNKRNAALADAEVEAWQQRLELAARGNLALEELQKRSFLGEFGTPLEQVETEFKDREELLRAYAETIGLTQEELNERLRILDEERAEEVRIAEDAVWQERFARARQGLDEYETIIKNIQDLENESAEVRKAAATETMDTVIGILRDGGEEANRVARALAIAQVVRDGVVAVQKAWASATFPYNLPAVALVSAQTLANVAKVKGARAFGGSVQQGQPYYTGEAGGEIFQGRSGSQIFIPPENGSITPVQAPKLNVQVNIHGSGAQNARVEQSQGPEGIAIIDVILEQTESRIANRLALGDGPLPRALENSYALTRKGL